MALNDQMQQMVQQDIKDAETRPKAEILKEQMDGLKTAGRTARDIAVESIPGVSEALSEKRVDEALQRGDTTGAIIEGAAGLMGAVPIVGDILSRPIRAAAKKLRKQDSDVATKMLSDVESIETWKKQNPNPKPQKQNPNIEKAANDLLEGKITGKQYRSVVKENMPIQKIEEVPEVPSFTEIVGALDKDKSAKGIIGLNKKIKDGTRVSSRLDIPAYERFDKWVVSVHDAFDKKGRESLSGDIMGYGKTAVLKNVEFKGSPTGAASISARKTDKGTIARIFGDYYNAEPENVEEYARQVIKDKDWTQVGYNPFRHGFFYDKNTGMPVKSAEEVIQVGPLVLAKNAQKIKISEAKQVGPKGGLKIRTGKPIEGLQNLKETKTVFNKGGAVPMADKKEYSIRQARRDAADFLGVRDATTRATKDARDYSAQTKQDDSYEDTLRHVLLGGLIKDVPGQENNMGKTIASKFINTKLMESDGKESEVDINNNKYGSSLRDRLIAAGDSSEEGFIKAAKAAVEQMKLQDFEDKSEGTSPRRSTEGRREIEMKTGGLAKQMELFEPVERGFNEGGLMDEGGMVDKESGNEVPPGSLREEVRDDIPAQLSEGEFVFPADVVRYIGLENLMRMRQEAKQGLAQMEAMGQMGNSEEAVMPDDLPFDMYDLDVEDDDNDYNMARGGVIKAANGTLATGTYKLPNTTGSYTTPAPVTTGYTPPPTLTQPFQPYTPQFTTATQEQGAFIPKTIDPLSPTFGEFIGQNIPGVDFDYVDYINDAGQIIKLRVDKATGELLDPIPEGYRLKTEEVQKTTSETQRVETAKVRDDGGRDDAGDRSPPGASTAFGGELVDGQVVGGYVGDLSFDNMSIKQAQSYMLSGVPSFLGQLTGKPNTNTLPDDAIANITNLSKTRPKGVYSGPAEVEFAATVRMKGTTYNDLLTGKKVTQRQKMADAIDFIKQKYGDDVMDPSKIIDLDIELADMNMREDVRDEIDRSDLSDAVKDVLSKNNDIGNVSVDSSGNLSINNPFEASRLDQASTGDYGDAYKDEGPPGKSGPSGKEDNSSSGSSDNSGSKGYGGGIGTGGGGAGESFGPSGGFSKGGDVTKQMKRSGLASKK